MSAARAGLRGLDTMARRIFVVLVIGIGLATMLSASVAEQRRIADLRGVQDVRTADRLATFAQLLERIPPAQRQILAEANLPFLRQVGGPIAGEPNRELMALLAARLPPSITAHVSDIPLTQCQGRKPPAGYTKADQIWLTTVAPTDCWLITARLPDGSLWRFVSGPPPLLSTSSGTDPLYLVVLAVVAANVAALVARMAARPVRALARAAAKLGPDLDAPPLAERGPAEVVTATRAFNAMQQRLRSHLTEQRHMIAAITHDLQTPMTRLRLRLDALQDGELRGRLLDDWRAMEAIVDQGLELARASDAQEALARLDVDSMIGSLVEDAAETGADVAFDRAAGQDIVCRPQMLRRCVQNLLDNAVKHGGDARLSTIATAKELVIEVRDHGPGIPENQLDEVFGPMVRLEASRSRETGGTGLGLTIARILARRNAAHVTLANAPDGGLIARLAIARTITTECQAG